MEIELRLEQPDDYRAVENVTREAFWNHHEPGCDEHYLIHTMRDSPEFVPELDHVALFEGAIVGHIAYATSTLKDDEGFDNDVLCLGPISVLPEFQSRGIGGRLIEHTKRIAKALGFSSIFLYGDPDYYSKHGFIPAEQFNIRTQENEYAAALQVCLLRKDALAGKSGRFFEGSIYEVDQSASHEFDRENFPEKERKSGLPSQKRFKELVAMRRKA